MLCRGLDTSHLGTWGAASQTCTNGSELLSQIFDLHVPSHTHMNYHMNTPPGGEAWYAPCPTDPPREGMCPVDKKKSNCMQTSICLLSIVSRSTNTMCSAGRSSSFLLLNLQHGPANAHRPLRRDPWRDSDNTHGPAAGNVHRPPRRDPWRDSDTTFARYAQHADEDACS